MIDGTLRAMAETAGRVKEVTGGEAPGLEFLATLIHAEALLALGETEEGDAMLAACEPVLLGDERCLGPPEVLGMAAIMRRAGRSASSAPRRSSSAWSARCATSAPPARSSSRSPRAPASTSASALAGGAGGADEAVTLGRETRPGVASSPTRSARWPRSRPGRPRRRRARPRRRERRAVPAQGAPATTIFGYQALACSGSASATSGRARPRPRHRARVRRYRGRRAGRRALRTGSPRGAVAARPRRRGRAAARRPRASGRAPASARG